VCVCVCVCVFVRVCAERTHKIGESVITVLITAVGVRVLIVLIDVRRVEGDGG
jgi:hypothetical protein